MALSDSSLATVRVQIKGDSSGLAGDLASAQNQAQRAGTTIASALTQSMKTAEAAVKSATSNMSEALAGLGPAAAAGNKVAQEALKSYETELRQAQSELNRLAASQTNVAATARVMATAQHAAVSEIQATSGAIRVLEGSGGLRAAERFLATTLGLGGVAQAIFPIVGAIALFDIVKDKVTEIAKAWDPVISAEKRAEDGAKEYDKQIVKLRDHLAEMAAKRLESAVGAAGSSAVTAAQREKDILAIRVQILATEDKIAKAKAEQADAENRQRIQGPGSAAGGSIIAGRRAQGSKIDIATETRELTLLQSRLREASEEQADISTRSLQEQSDANDKRDADMKTAADKAKAALDKDRSSLKSGYALMLDDLKADHSLTLQEEVDFWQDRLSESLQSGQRYSAIQHEIANTVGKLQIQASEESARIREKDAKEEESFNEQMSRNAVLWAQRTHEAKEQRIREAKIDTPLLSRVAGPVADVLALEKAGIQTSTLRSGQIAEDQKLLDLARQYDVPLGTQLNLRAQILQDSIALGEQEGKNVSGQIIALSELQSQMSALRSKSDGLAPLFLHLKDIGKGIPGSLGGALAGGLMSGNPGKGIGQEIRQSLQGVGHQILGTIFQEGIRRLVISLGLNTLANSLLKFVFGAAAAGQVANTTAVAANTIGQGILAISNGVLTGATAALTAAVIALTVATSVDAIMPFADGGRPPMGVPSLVGERGPELFIPNQAGHIVPNHLLGSSAAALPLMMASIASGSVGSMNFHAHGMTNPRQFIREVAREIPKYLKSTSPGFSPASR